MRRFNILAMAAATFSMVTGAAPITAQTVARLSPAPGLRLNADYLIGSWSDREDCGSPIEFRRDGQFLNPDGTRGTWRLEGDVLTFTAARTVVVRLVPRSRDETIVVQANGGLGYSRRCSVSSRRP